MKDWSADAERLLAKLDERARHKVPGAFKRPGEIHGMRPQARGAGAGLTLVVYGSGPKQVRRPELIAVNENRRHGEIAFAAATAQMPDATSR